MKKIIGYIIILMLLAGSVCGITYGVMYYNLENKTDPEYAEELENKVSDYQDQMNTYYLTILDLQSQINDLKLQGTTDSATISSLESTITSLNSTVDSLNATNTANEETIAENEKTIADLKSQISQLESDVNDKSSEITVLNNTISSLETQNVSLQKTNESNLTLITSLNDQIVTLNEQIATLSKQVTSNTNTVTALNAEIAKLQETISYYETYIASLETDDQAAVTFMFDGSVYSIQIVTKGQTVSVADPTSTDYVTFNGWTIDGESVDLSEYAITSTTTFTADVTYSYDVKFVANGETVNSQIVAENGTATLPEDPTIAGYDFDGWTIDSVTVIDPSEYVVTGTTTFIAKLTALHTVSFIYESDELSSLSVRDGEYATTPSVTDTEYKTFNGWLLNGEAVDVSTYAIVADVVFTADITYSYDVTFVANEVTVDSQIVKSGSYATIPSDPSLENYVFDGWSINGTDLVDVETYEITHATTFTAVFTALYTVTFVNDDNEYASQVLLANSIVEDVEDPAKEGYGFMGWSEDNETVIDLETYSITKNTALYAVYSEVLDWEFSDYAVTSYIGTDTDLVIPSSYALSREGYFVVGNDIAVNEAEYSLFNGNTTITSVVIPDTITSLEYGTNVFSLYPGRTFYGCTSLTSVTLSNSLTYLGDYTFYGCSSLRSITIPDSVVIIGSYCFNECSNLVEINFGKNVGRIGGAAFKAINSSAVFNFSASCDWFYYSSSASNATCSNISASEFTFSSYSSSYVYFNEKYFDVSYTLDDGSKLYSLSETFTPDYLAIAGLYYYDAETDIMTMKSYAWCFTFTFNEDDNTVLCSSAVSYLFDVETKTFTQV